ncbi:hypothetical protein BKA70DRAFT_1394094 [Coprinopsis sp. MPI-PUGE-AT-0042]|nr:hypothetical protein BKA70DRAFT_1394094 [Coprinopsis sp. MPI-PUGE-AT-0042]
MSIAPPTPPPTTTTELQDSAQGSSVVDSQSQPPSQSQNAPSAVSDPYQVAFIGISQIASQNNWLELVKTAEEIDNVTFGGEHLATRLLIVVPLVLAYLIEDEVAPARYALERLPDSLSKHQLIGMLETLAKVVQSRSHSKVYATASNIADLVGRPDFFHPELGNLVTQMCTRFVVAFRLRTFQLLSKAYSSLPVKLAQDYLGVPADTIINEAVGQGWRYDPGTENLLPRSSAAVTAQQSSRGFTNREQGAYLHAKIHIAIQPIELAFSESYRTPPGMVVGFDHCRNAKHERGPKRGHIWRLMQGGVQWNPEETRDRVQIFGVHCLSKRCQKEDLVSPVWILAVDNTVAGQVDVAHYLSLQRSETVPVELDQFIEDRLECCRCMNKGPRFYRLWIGIGLFKAEAYPIPPWILSHSNDTGAEEKDENH